MNRKIIQLLGGAMVEVNFEEPETECRRCKKKIRFAITIKNQKKIPIIKAGENWQAHFTDCQFEKEFRKPKETAKEKKQRRIAEITAKYNSLSDEEKRNFNFYQKI